MNCAPFDLKDYFFGEMSDADRGVMLAHVKTCIACNEELERLRMTEATLLTLRDEEIPQRIAFVSDRVYEPSALRRWWNAFWASGPRVVFASAAMLSVAVLARPLTQQAAAPQSVDTASIEKQVAERVEKAVAASELEQAQQTRQLIADAVARSEQTQRVRMEQLASSVSIWEKTADYWEKSAKNEYRANHYQRVSQ
jgi:anti-sigma factor RsiW